MTKTGASLKTITTPHGIVDLEFAYNIEKAHTVLQAWAGANPIDNIYAAKLNTWLDFIFLCCYGTLLYLVCYKIAIATDGLKARLGKLFANLAIVAAMLDIVENAGMLLTLNYHVSSMISALTFTCSIIKWLAVIAAILYILVAAPLVWHEKIKKSNNN